MAAWWSNVPAFDPMHAFSPVPSHSPKMCSYVDWRVWCEGEWLPVMDCPGWIWQIDLQYSTPLWGISGHDDERVSKMQSHRLDGSFSWFSAFWISSNIYSEKNVCPLTKCQTLENQWVAFIFIISFCLSVVFWIHVSDQRSMFKTFNSDFRAAS